MWNDWPGIDIAGTYSPPLKASVSEADGDEMIAEVNEAKPDVLWVRMTALSKRSGLPTRLTGWTPNFLWPLVPYSTTIIEKIGRSHPIIQKLGLEWLPRLLQEPSRLWRRMFVSAPIFVWHVIKMRFGIMPR